MKNVAGSILTIGGLAFLTCTGINYLNNSERFSLLGTDFVVSRVNIVPVIISAVVLVLGVVLVISKKHQF